MIPATYEEAQRALTEFIPRAGRFYAEERNFDRGPENRKNVSLLSAALQRRIITEREVIQEVLKHHSFEAAEKFIQEVLWRSYWKSWLELRPSVWSSYLQALKAPPHFDQQIYQKAIEAQTGIECFDEWRKELKKIGYLHNHARMWFASIWIFTLRLPWELGAHLFEKELLDFDAASNTLSWRWVAGLHTPGKHYIARAENIRKFTEARFNPEGQLNEKAVSPSHLMPPMEPSLEFLEEVSSVPEEWGLLVHSEDLSLERTEMIRWPLKKVGMLQKAKSDNPVKRAFEERAFQDAKMRLSHGFSCPLDELLQEEIVDWAKKNELRGICLIKPWQGPLLDLLHLPLPLKYFKRAYDVPWVGKARTGFFSFKEEMKNVLIDINKEKANLEKLCLMSLKK